MDFKAWTEALRSGNYEQCTGQLHNGEGFCCIGVWAAGVLGIDPNDFKVEPIDDEDQDPEYPLFEEDLEMNTLYGQDIYVHFKQEVGKDVMNLLISMNDNMVPFEEIANIADDLAAGASYDKLKPRVDALCEQYGGLKPVDAVDDLWETVK